MKRKRKKLALKRISVTVLREPELEAVAGGSNRTDWQYRTAAVGR